MPEGITITVKYDKVLQEITGTEKHPVCVSKGSVFAFLLHCMFIEYPEIEERYPPGTLGFTVNGYPPKTYSPLFEGDEVFFTVV